MTTDEFIYLYIFVNLLLKGQQTNVFMRFPILSSIAILEHMYVLVQPIAF